MIPRLLKVFWIGLAGGLISCSLMINTSSLGGGDDDHVDGHAGAPGAAGSMNESDQQADEACVLPNSISEVNPETGRCSISHCLEPFDDCNLEPLDGCEVNLSSSPEHCGACAMVCSTLCVAGDCRLP